MKCYKVDMAAGQWILDEFEVFHSTSSLYKPEDIDEIRAANKHYAGKSDEEIASSNASFMAYKNDDSHKECLRVHEVECDEHGKVLKVIRTVNIIDPKHVNE